MEGATSSSVLVTQLAKEWAWISWLTVSGIFALESALALL
jgi:hypothetical protein